MAQVQALGNPGIGRLSTMPSYPPSQSISAVTSCAALAGRVLYSSIFVMSTFGHFSKQTIDHAAEHGVPMPEILVPLSGLIALAGGLSVLVGCRARIGALLLVIFLIPVTIQMHNFWAVTDPEAARIQQIMFMKNLSMLGAALLIIHFGAGPFSVDAWNKRRSEQTHS